MRVVPTRRNVVGDNIDWLNRDDGCWFVKSRVVIGCEDSLKSLIVCYLS